MKVKPRLFNWDKREWYEGNKSDGSKMKEQPTAGFIAQELDEVQTNENAEWLNLVLKDNPDKIEATYGNLLPVMVKAIQELKDENDMLKERLMKFEQMVNSLSNNEKMLLSQTK
ncbi:MAG: tail fiber domain-containing protein [Ignavibacteria bacterium]|nr:tail fiber domain-containing protein [Ignavibacteria bacterium]